MTTLAGAASQWNQSVQAPFERSIELAERDAQSNERQPGRDLTGAARWRIAMNAIRQTAAAVLIGMSLSLLAARPAAAEELPTGAARVVEKVQTRIFISKSSLLFKVDAILANQPSPGGE
jgi:hypothetical protein